MDEYCHPEDQPDAIHTFEDVSGVIRYFRESSIKHFPYHDLDSDGKETTLLMMIDGSCLLLREDLRNEGSPARGEFLSESDAVQWLLKHECTPPECESFEILEYGYSKTGQNEEPESGVDNPRERPSWDRELSVLMYRNKLVRKVRPIAVRVVTLLDVFEEDGWPQRVDNPFPDDQKMREAIASLNRNLTAIRFKADGSGEGILWEPLLPTDTPQRNDSE